MLEILSIFTGIFGGAVTSIINYFNQKQKNSHEIELRNLDIRMIEVEADKKMQISRVETEGKVELGELDALKESYKEANTSLFDRSYMQTLMSSKWFSWVGALIATSFGVVDFLKHLARPLITYYLLGVSTYLTILCYKLLEKWSTTGALSLPEAYNLFQLSVQSLLYLTISCVAWWFADRRVAKFLMRLDDGNSKTS
uniref:Uncharacterized protein n=1 Tax=viral metagenome TaxID=1070528 RepID=A0A6M3JX62_9ZZZZ